MSVFILEGEEDKPHAYMWILVYGGTAVLWQPREPEEGYIYNVFIDKKNKKT